MKIRFIYLFLILTTIIFALPKTRCWLYELKNKRLILVKVSVSNLLPENNYQDVLILDYDDTPNETQLEQLRINLCEKLGIDTNLNEQTQPETQ